MKLRGFILRGGLFLAAAAVGTVVVMMGPSAPASAQMAKNSAVSFDSDGAMTRPEGYREWVYVGTPLTPNDMNNGTAPFPEFHSVYMEPSSWAAYKKTGKYPDGTTFVKELVSVGSKRATSGKGYFMGDFIGLEVAMKDSKRFKDEPGYWAYFSFGHKYPLAKTATAFPAASCNACHDAAAADDWVFAQYYPVLRAAKKAAAARGGEAVHDGATCAECKDTVKRFAEVAPPAKGGG